MKHYKILIVILVSSLLSFGDIIRDYPSHNYVLNELDVREDYIYNRDFQKFILKNQRKYTKIFIRAINRGRRVIPTMRKNSS